MPVLPNPRHERFAQEVAKGKSQSEAYRLAGYSSKGNAAEVSAARLIRNAQVRARVDELQARVAEHAAEEASLDRTWVLLELRKIAQEPVGSTLVKPSDKRAALVDIAKIQGWIIERSESGGPGDFDRMSEDELRAFIAGRTDRIGESQTLIGSERGGGKPSGKPH